jgi:hypothetical protein
VQEQSKKREDGKTYFVGRYAGLSRGKHCAKHVSSGTWAKRPEDSTEDVLVLDIPGKWMLHSSDGFNRKRTEYIMVE